MAKTQRRAPQSASPVCQGTVERRKRTVRTRSDELTLRARSTARIAVAFKERPRRERTVETKGVETQRARSGHRRCVKRHHKPTRFRFSLAHRPWHRGSHKRMREQGEQLRISSHSPCESGMGCTAQAVRLAQPM